MRDDARDRRHPGVVLRYRAPRTGELRALAPAAGEQLGARNAAEPRRRQGALDASAGAARLIGSSPIRSGAKVRRRSSRPPAIVTGGCGSRRIRSSIARRVLELGYRPARLRFLSQGSGPFTLAFGSRRAEIAAASGCDALLADVSVRGARETRSVEGLTQGARVLGGDNALRPLPQTDARSAGRAVDGADRRRGAAGRAWRCRC